MSQFTVTIELKGCDLNGTVYSRLDELIEVEGFKRRVHPLDGRFHPANFLPLPGDLPRATYYGQCDQDALALQGDLLSRIPSEWQPVITVTPRGVER